MVHPLADYTYNKLGKRRAVVFGADYPGGYEHVRAFERVFKQLGGTVVKEMWAPMGTTDFAPYLVGLENVDVVYAFFFGGDAIRLLKQYREFGLQGKITLVGNNLADEQILPAIGEGAQSVITAESYSPNIDTPVNRAFVARYRKEYGIVPTQYSEYGYTGARVIFAALEAVKGRVEDKEKFLAALRNVNVSDTPRGPVKLDKYQQAVLTAYIRKAEKVGNEYQNTIIDTIPNVSQFWKWTPEAYMKGPKYVR
jgi:branched-chain amino acid transport system substrate-binding protein